MNFNKIGLVALSAGAIFMATSCNKDNGISLKKATEWVAENFKKEAGTYPDYKSVHVQVNFAGTKGKGAIEFAKTMTEALGAKFDEKSLAGDDTVSIDEFGAKVMYGYWTKDSFTGEYNEDSIKETHAKFSLSNDVLTITEYVDCTEEMEESMFTSGRNGRTAKLNKDGATLFENQTIKNGKNTEKLGKDGVLNGSIKLTFNFKK